MPRTAHGSPRPIRLSAEQLEDRAVPALTRLTPEFAVNTTVVNAQVNPSVAADSLGNFATAWDSTTAVADTDVRGRSVVAQRSRSSSATSSVIARSTIDARSPLGIR